ncbi:LEAF RUST 10 DISEASE-RESISTANCE LOCUS RECEPTOR-LIKE PROTEIN KINASE-like 1.2 isoform X2 [Lycium ferocissimum]|uniref:LEAF RUST 10 DISEASE-RESISTANCE LOCUS RECEPTOR-LIKE PROTEIN KINASE-like 1.2 isoform X2 n=1 Tax=Lycium ferocissimum TaxID=112874 RepID=UPI002815145E|nr:LEAF RUST 10 DISEASE-RESISTANCE LOCUS RECEPTOR-LIKE PROTEIN KINASE-like 1.2 isoform X2 [Lycium ferocissimum]
MIYIFSCSRLQMNQEKKYFLIASLNLCVLSLILQIDKCFAVDSQFVACEPINCKYGPKIRFPFYIQDEQEAYCGYPGFGLNCSEQGFPVVNIAGNEYIVEDISYQDHIFKLKNSVFNSTISNGCVSEIKNVSLDNRSFKFVNISRIYLLSKCNESLLEPFLKYKIGCGEELAMFDKDESFEFALQVCKNHVMVPVEMLGNEGNNQNIDYQVILRRGFRLSWTASNCSECAESGGRCGFDIPNFQFKCFCPDRPHSASCKPTRINKLRLILGSVLGGAVLIILVVALIVCCYKKEHKSCLYFTSKNKSSDPSLTHDFDGDSIYHGVSVFSYAELEEATSNFDSSNELGDGGFGAVYYGKLKDGREVAVKRLYEHNCKRMEQFKNEIEILTRLRHRNLVTLYGCTSKHSRELLLVYEYVPNGTVADHLNGDRAKDGFLAWPVRMNIAIETASALAYLHASDIIHRDVKTSNILLDGNCCVKVADFGLSRLFPNDATHVSTAPQGTAGYVDPEYHECYQLTDKSDVYSFGVVLVELISSMPAVDITRRRSEINLANLAINRIQRCAFDELIDPCLGFKSDAQVMRMTTSVAELAFRCLQLETDLRPTMDEVLETLKHIQGAYTDHTKDEKTKDEIVEKAPTSPKSDKVVLLNKMQLPPSPISVTERWVSSCGSSNISG